MTESALKIAANNTLAPVADPLTVLHRWAEQGWLRRLDSALAALMRELDPATTPVLLASAAILTHMEGRGHTCLPLRLLVTQPDEVLAWPATAREEISSFWQTLPASLSDWLASLRASPLVRPVTLAQAGDAPQHQPDQGQPLVLGGTEKEPLLCHRAFHLRSKETSHCPQNPPDKKEEIETATFRFSA